MMTLDHSQCLPWCGHLIKMRDERIKLALHTETLRRAVAICERELKVLDEQIARLKELGANA